MTNRRGKRLATRGLGLLGKLGWFAFALMFFAAKADATSRHWGREQGLDLFSITSMTRDTYGFLWLSGQDGVVRFDGYKFERLEALYPHLAYKVDRFTWSIRQDNSNGLWIGTRDGLTHIHLEEGKSVSIAMEDEQPDTPPTAFTTMVADGNTLWLGTEGKGLWKYDSNTRNLVSVPGPNAASQINAMVLQDGQLWIGTGPNFLRESGHAALLSFDPAQNHWRVRSAPKGKGISAIEKAEDGTLWIGTFGAGLHPFNTKTETFGHQVTGLPNAVTALKMDRQHHLWIGTQDGLFKAVPRDGHPLVVEEIHDLQGAHVSSLYLDPTDNLWIGTWSQGLHQINLFDNGIHTLKGPRGHGPLAADQVLSMTEDSDRSLWLALWSGGVQRWKHNGGWENVASDLPGKARQLAWDKENHLWLGTDKAIGWYDTSSKRFRVLKTDKQSNCAANVLMLRPDKERGMWVGTRKGGLCFYPSLKAQPERPLDKFREAKLLPSAISVDALWQSESGELWIGTESHGLFRLSADKGQLQHWHSKSSAVNRAKLRSNFITDIVADAQGRIWVGTEGGGVLQVLQDPQGDVQGFSALTRHEGLLSEAVAGILPVGENEVWIASTAGLTRFRPNDGTIKNFLVDNSFYNGARFRSVSGELFFGGTDGLTRFFPEKVALNPHIPNVAITGLRLTNTWIHPSPEGPVSKPFPFAKRVTVPYQKNTFAITFTALDFANPARNHYRYRLEGFDKEWINTDANNRQAVYTNIEPGSYTFQVVASNSDGLWNQEGSELDVVVLGPPWSTQWLKLGLFGLLLLTAAVAYWQFRQRQRLRDQHVKSLAESEERLSLALWASGDEFWDWNMLSGDTIRLNQLKLNVLPRRLLLEQPETLRNFVHEADVPLLMRSFLRHRAGKELFYECCYRVRDSEQHWNWVQDRGKIVDWSDEGEPLRMLGTLRDINVQKRTEEELGVIAKSLANISDAVWITDDHFDVVFVNNAYCELTGKRKEEVLNKPLHLPHVHNQDAMFESNVKRYLKSQGKWHGELWQQGPQGQIFPISLTIDSVKNREGDTTHFIGVFSDISQQRKSKEQLRELAEYDRLTGLYNHTRFLQELERRMAESEFHGQSQMALLMVSLDDFKNINDTYGMKVGDQVLKAVGRLLATVDDNLVALSRFSGDEFCGLLLSPGQRNNLMDKASQILGMLKQPLEVNGGRIRVGASVGLALFPDHAGTPLALFEKAHAAMSHLKRAGGNGIQIFNEALDMRARFGSQLDTELRHAIKLGELEIHANPRVALASGKWLAVETHLRWRSPRRGLLAASSFMPIAEQSGLAHDLVTWFVEHLPKTAKAIDRAAEDLVLAIPLLSGKVLKVDILEPGIDSLLSHGVAVNRLEFIIPEHVLMTAGVTSQRCLEMMREKGVGIQVSTFGSTPRTLDWVKSGWLSSVRLGRTVVSGIGLSPVHDAAAETLIRFARAMNLPIQAEGIETEVQLDTLKQLQCDWGSGSLLGETLPLDELIRFMEENPRDKQ